MAMVSSCVIPHYALAMYDVCYVCGSYAKKTQITTVRWKETPRQLPAVSNRKSYVGVNEQIMELTTGT